MQSPSEVLGVRASTYEFQGNTICSITVHHYSFLPISLFLSVILLSFGTCCMTAFVPDPSSFPFPLFSWSLPPTFQGGEDPPPLPSLSLFPLPVGPDCRSPGRGGLPLYRGGVQLLPQVLQQK